MTCDSNDFADDIGVGSNYVVNGWWNDGGLFSNSTAGTDEGS